MTSRWHPIFAAPRDGTEILASNYDAIEIVSWSDLLFPAGWHNREGQIMFPAWWQPLPDHPLLP
jgi:hypothetical protein